MSAVKASAGRIDPTWDGTVSGALGGSGGVSSETEGATIPAPPKPKRGRITNVGGHRVVNYYELTEDELDSLGIQDRDATRHFAVAAFALGWAVDLTKDFLFDPPKAGTMTGLEIALLIVAVLASGFYFFQGFSIRKTGAAKLRRIKDAHDFS